MAATGVCFWIVGDRRSPGAGGIRAAAAPESGPSTRPALGVVVVLLTTNLTAGMPSYPVRASTWLGLLAPSALCGDYRLAQRRRSGVPSRPDDAGCAGASRFFRGRRSCPRLLINRTQDMASSIGSWHFALILRMARGALSTRDAVWSGRRNRISLRPQTCWHRQHGQCTAGVMPWTALATSFKSFFDSCACFLSPVGFAYDLGTPLPLAWGALVRRSGLHSFQDNLSASVYRPTLRRMGRQAVLLVFIDCVDARR